MATFLTDFGLAKDTATGSRYTRTGVTLGTPAYMSPEQARGDVTTLGPATDVWSLGCVLHEALAGGRAFEADTPAAVIARVLGAEPQSIRRLRADVPAGVERLIRACLAKRAAARRAGPRALRDDLDRVRRGARPRARIPGMGRRLAAVAVVGGILASGVGGAWAWRGAMPLPAPAPEDPLAVAWAWRVDRPRDAAARLARALAIEPGRHQWRVVLGALRWGSDGSDAARAEWARVPPDAPAHAEACWLSGLARFADALVEDEPARLPAVCADWRAAAASAGRAADWARAALAVVAHDAAAGVAPLDIGVLDPAADWSVALLRGLLASNAMTPDDADGLRAYSAALERGPLLPFAYLQRAKLRTRIGDHAAALVDYDLALRHGCDRVRVWNARGTAYERAGDLAQARADFDAALAERPDDLRALMNRGVLHLRAGEATAALRDLDAAVALDPTHVDARYNRALLHQDAGRLDLAMVDFDAALRVRPDDGQLLHRRGHARAMLGDPAGARADYDRAVELAPGRASLRSERARLRARQGDLDGALADLDAALAADPEQFDARYNRALLRDRRGDAAGALTDLDAALVLRAEDLDCRMLRAMIRVDRGDFAGARQDAEVAVRVAPQTPDTWFMLGTAHRLAGAWAAAADALRRGIELGADHPRLAEARAWLAESEARAASAGR